MTRLSAIESALGTIRGATRAYPTPDNRAHRFELRVLEIDPHADAIPWPSPSVTTITEPIDLGPFEDAAPCRVLLLRRHGLFGGATGSGKSTGINALMGNLSACRDVMLLRDAVAVLEARADYLSATGQRVWVPSPEFPALVVIEPTTRSLRETRRTAQSALAAQIAQLNAQIAHDVQVERSSRSTTVPRI